MQEYTDDNTQPVQYTTLSCTFKVIPFKGSREVEQWQNISLVCIGSWATPSLNCLL